MKGLTGAATIGAVIFVSVVFALAAFAFVVPVFSAHDNSASLEPEWSPAGQNVAYTVSICNEPDGGDSIDEVRIYQNGSYSAFVVDSKTGWYLGSFNPVKKYYQLTATESSYYIDEGECTDFTFSATTPESLTPGCEWQWQFETRDITDVWKFANDTTSVDDLAPNITKEVTGPQSGPCPPGEGEECWITQSTTIKIEVTEQGDCGISGLDYCEITYAVDGGVPQQEVYADLGGETYWEYPMSFIEDSMHVLNVTCADIAGNVIEDIETFRVDSEAPETEKEFNGPQKIDGLVEWIDGITTIELTAVDPDPTGEECNIGVAETWYVNILAENEDMCWYPEEYCVPQQVCEPQEMRTAECERWACLGEAEKDFFITGRSDTTNWDMAIWEYIGGTPPEVVRESGEYQWVNGGDPVPFTVSYDPDTGLVTYTIDETTLTWTYDSGKAFEFLVIMAKGNDGGDMSLTDVEVNGVGVGDVVSSGNYQGLQVYLPDSMQADGFIVTGMAAMAWETKTTQEIPGMHVFAMNTHEPEPCPVYQIYTGEPIKKDEESCHILQYFSVDELGNEEEVEVNCFFVDKTPPEVEKCNGDAIKDKGESMFITPDNPEGIFHWLTTDMPITFTCTDQQPHPSGDEKLCFKVSYDYPGWGYITDDYCDTALNAEGYCCIPATVKVPFDFYFKEESMHNLEYYCIDAVEKKSDVEIQYYKVDDTAPSIEKEMIGEDHLGYRDGELNEDACPPKEGENDDCFVRDDGLNGVRVTVEDGGEVCAVGDVTCVYALWWYTEPENCEGTYSAGRCLLESGEFFDEVSIYFNEDSTHTLYVNCLDALGNGWETMDTEIFLVDSTPPVTTKTLGPEGTYYIEYIEEEINREWIDTATRITLEAEDEKVGVDETYYRISGSLGDQFCESKQACDGWMTALRPAMGEWNTYVEPFGIDEESCHVVEYRSIDKLGNEEDIKWQCIFVDKIPPITTKTYIGPQYPKEDVYPKWIDGITTVELTVDDAGPHKSGIKETKYRVTLVDDEYCDGTLNCEDAQGEDGWETYEEPFSMEESCHLIEYYSVDNVGKTEEVNKQCVFVDKTKPIVSAYTGDPKIECEPGEECDYWIRDHVTEITLSCYDPEPHPSGVALVEYRWKLDDGDWTDWMEYEEPIIFEQDSVHYLEYRCTDNVEKMREGPGKVYKVDSTPPETEKTYGEPIYPEKGYPKWISSQTPITLEAEDGGEICAVGIDEIQYRVSGPLADSFCMPQNCENWMQMLRPDMGPWNIYTGPFTIDEDSCHVIEYRSVDLLGNEEDIKWQCVFVDNQSPEPVKEVGEPKEPWNGLDAIFYNLTGFCNEEEENCWKVTLDTEISLDCVDEGPHPVDHETTCFKVEVDGEDATERYCEELGLSEGYDKFGDGYCCGGEAPYIFKFLEETEHNLAYYCVDALDNKGEPDDEKFKVMGRIFEIQLNKKWNLISMPFNPIDPAPEEVFENTLSVEAVWTYDSELNQWLVYRPGENETNNLEEIVTGLGYWVLADCEEPEGEDKVCDYLLVGGSLYEPGPVTPPSRQLKEGWNLIGYYGTDDEEGYYGPWENGKEAYCSLYSLRNLDGGLVNPTKWSGLITYWEPNNPNQWYELDLCNGMDPGAGYWIGMEADGTYKPSTICESSILDVLCWF